ncbi:ANTH domain [Trypanosoma vivax]|nr:ANTH domain [Trypanosoma vivax]
MMNDRDKNELKRGVGYLKEKAILGLSRVTGADLDRAIIKLTSHKLKVPKEKHMQRLLSATYGNYNTKSQKERNVHEYIISKLEKRLHTHNWIVVLKTLVTFHRLINDGSEDVNQCIQKNRNIFCARNMKDLTENREGAAQSLFIRQYSFYLEERTSSQRAIGVSMQMDTSEFSLFLSSMNAEALVPVFDALLIQFSAIVDIDYRESIVDNFCTLEAYQYIVNDGKLLYKLLSNRVIFIIDVFKDLSINLKKIWLERVRRYAELAEKLRVLFFSIATSSKVFHDPPPHLKPIPETLLKSLEDDLSLSGARTEVVIDTLQSLGITCDGDDVPKETQHQNYTRETANFSTGVGKDVPTLTLDDLFMSPTTVTPIQPTASVPSDSFTSGGVGGYFYQGGQTSIAANTTEGIITGKIPNNAVGADFSVEWTYSMALQSSIPNQVNQDPQNGTFTHPRQMPK